MFTRCSRAGVFVLAAFALPLCHAATLWTGPNITWTKSGSTPSDTIIPAKLVLMRGTRDVLYNAAREAGAGPASPTNTMWAFGNIADYNTLSYQTLESMRSGDLATKILNKPMVMHYTNDDIYISIRFTIWGRFGSGTVSYTRSTPPAVSPTVSITSPSAGAVFVAPASVGLTANATVSGGTVTNVEYFAGTTSLGRAGVTPFSVTGSIPAPGSYALTAVAKAGGVSATSSVVNITVVSRPVATLTAPADGAVFATPADVNIMANATVSGTTVTNISIYNQTTLLGSGQGSPFNLTASNLTAGAYSLTAVATASGVSGTSSVVNINVVSPVPVSLVQPSISNGLFSFSYSADPGLSYVIQGSSDLLNWAPVVTNVALSNPVLFSEGFTTDPARFYRVGRLPNP